MRAFSCAIEKRAEGEGAVSAAAVRSHATPARGLAMEPTRVVTLFCFDPRGAWATKTGRSRESSWGWLWGGDWVHSLHATALGEGRAASGCDVCCLVVLGDIKREIIVSLPNRGCG